MTRGASKRRLRVRRKRKSDGFVDDVADTAGSAPEVVAQFGCCIVEAVGSLSIFIGLLFVPAYVIWG